MASKPEPALAGDSTTPNPPPAADEPTREQLRAAAEADAYTRAGHGTPAAAVNETPGE